MEKISKAEFVNNVQGIVDEMKTQIDAYASQVFENAASAREAEASKFTFQNIINRNGLNLSEAIRNIASSEAVSNNALMETIDQYAAALNNGIYEEHLYESFLQNISKFDYLLPVKKEIKRINEVATNKNLPILITKILEEMSATQSYYIIPLIEEDACRFVKDANDINRVQLRNVLCSFASDPYCNQILNILEKKSDNFGKTLSEKTLNINDRIKLVRENANITPIFSPVQYIKEGESVFNANGHFYVKKGNTLSKLSEEYLGQLSDKFVSLCQLINDPHVTLYEDHIVLNGVDKVACIYENYIDINGQREDPAKLRDINEMSCRYDYDSNFFIMATCLYENFNNIAIIDFGKHVSLNEDEKVNVDMFRLGDNIYVNAVNENFFKSTFYHNVNPIQCRNIINKHMGINVASLFEDLIPSQEKILLKLNETKNEYEESIEKYEETIKKLKDAKKNCSSDDNEKKLDDALKTAESKLKEIKADYVEWQKDAQKMTDANEDEETSEKKSDKKDDKATDVENDPNTEVEKSNEPIDIEDVDKVKPELTQHINMENESQDNDENSEDIEQDNSEIEPVDNISDEDFDNYLNDENNNTDEPVENTEVPEENAEDMPNMISDENAEITSTEETPAEEVVSDENNEENNGFTEINPDNEIEETPEEDENPEETTEDVDFNDDSIDMPDEEPIDNDIENDNYVNGEMSQGDKVMHVTFDQNIKTGEIFKSGSVVVITPMVNELGKIYNESNMYKFYIDEETHKPVIETEGMTLELYNSLVDVITSDENFSKADTEGVVNDEVQDNNVWFDSDAADDHSDDNSNIDDLFKYTEDEKDNSFTISPKEESTEDITTSNDSADDINFDDDDETIANIFGNYDKNEYVEKDNSTDSIPTYKEGETDIELPAATTDNTDIPEISDEEVKDPSILDNEEKEDAIQEAINNGKYVRMYSLNEAKNAMLKMKKEFK